MPLNKLPTVNSAMTAAHPDAQNKHQQASANKLDEVNHQNGSSSPLLLGGV